MAGNNAIRRANVIGMGLIGGSVSLALQKAGFVVHGDDADNDRVDLALERGVINQRGIAHDAEIGIAATPVLTLTDTVQRLLMNQQESSQMSAR